MKEKYIKDYAADAFRFYAKFGDIREYKHKIWNEALESGRSQIRSQSPGKPTESAIIRAEKAIEQAKPELDDLEAAQKTLRRLNIQQPEIALAVRIVYMSEPESERRKGDLKRRIIKATMEIPASERSVYYWLDIATTVFAKERGLRVSD